MTANQVAIATTSGIAAEAGAEIAGLGGNAVDCGIASALCSINTQPGVCALAGSAFVTIWEPDGQPITIDGNVAVPGKGLPDNFKPRAETVEIAYGGGVETMVGASSVAVPGTLAALFLAAEKYGSLPWRELLQPTIRATREGFPLAEACRYYLGYAGDLIYQRSDDGYEALHDADGALLDTGSTIVVPHLSDSLEAIAEEGERVFYKGDIGRRLVEHVQARGGMLTMHDLQTYQPTIRDSLLIDIADWQIAANPPPAIGGANLAAMLTAFGTETMSGWHEAEIRRLIETQASVMNFRRRHLDRADEFEGPVARLLEAARSGDLVSKYASGSTVHTSAVDAAGTACAITASSGYGSGEMPDGTGLWLNNCLGELELNWNALDAGPPGKRLPSNMAPGAARRDGSVMAIGSPGADRITTALHQFLVNFMQLGLDLDDAIAQPRLHLKLDHTGMELAVEPGIEVPHIDYPVSRFDQLNMYFGGVVAALFDAAQGLQAAADPRREGGTFISTSRQG